MRCSKHQFTFPIELLMFSKLCVYKRKFEYNLFLLIPHYSIEHTIFNSDFSIVDLRTFPHLPILMKIDFLLYYPHLICKFFFFHFCVISSQE